MSGIVERKVFLDDGHKPGSTNIDTTVISYENRQSTKFAAVFDDVLSNEWRDRIYRYALARGRPWGNIILFLVYLVDLDRILLILLRM